MKYKELNVINWSTCQGLEIHIILRNYLFAADIEDLVNLRESSSENGKCFRYCLLEKCEYVKLIFQNNLLSI